MKLEDLIIRDATDRGTLEDVVVKAYHVPKLPLKKPELIVDLGCHAGYTLLHLAHLYPKARLHGFDLSRENVDAARANVKIAQLEHRIEVDCAGISDAPGRGFPTSGASNTHQIVRDPMGEVPLITMDELITVVDGEPDFVKFDIEGAEQGIFRTGRWEQSVKHLRAELHWEYTVEMAVRDLEAKGYVVIVDPIHPACVEAWK